jgi:predicted Zn finger-like uncharacterized protein
MQLTCPSCGSRYRIDASSWPTEPGPEGEPVLRARKVRCKVCRDVWHAVPEEEALELDDPLPPEEGPRPAAWASIGGWPEPRPVEPTLNIPPPVFAAPMVLTPIPPPPMVPQSSFPPIPMPADPPLHFERPPGLAPSPAGSVAGDRAGGDRAGGRARLPGPMATTPESRATEPEAPEKDDEPEAAPDESDGWSEVAYYEETDRPRRWWLWLGGLLATAAILWIALVLTGRVRPEDHGLPPYNPAALQLPGWANTSKLGLPTISVPQAPLPPLTLGVDAEKRRLAGNRLVWEVRGTVTNPTGQRHAVPPVELLLLDGENRIVGRWTVRPDLETLAPGAVTRFETSAIDPPETAVRLRVQMKPQGLGRV